MSTWIFGMAGTGKTTFMAHEILRDLEDGNGVIVLDPNGDLSDAVLSRCPKRRTRDVLIIDPTDDMPVGFNPLSGISNKPRVAELLKDTIKELAGYDRTPTPLMERVLYNSVAALLEYPGATLLDLEPMLIDKAFRSRVLEHVSDTYVLRRFAYWDTFAAKEFRQTISSSENKAGDFSEDPRIRHILGQQSTFDLSTMLFDQKVIILRLPRLELGAKSRMLGSLFLAYLLVVAARRGPLPPVPIYIDDCNEFDTPPLRQLLSQSERLGLPVTVSNQYLDQLSIELRASLFGNCQRRVMFRTGVADSAELHRTIPENNTEAKLHTRLPWKPMYFDGKYTSRIESIEIPSLNQGSTHRKSLIVRSSRRQYGSIRQKVEESLLAACREKDSQGK